MYASVQVDGRRENGRWRRGSAANQESLNSDWKNKITQAGTGVDYKNDSRFGESQLSKLELL